MLEFTKDLALYLAPLTIDYSKILLIGDMNYWANEEEGSKGSKELTELLKILNLEGHIYDPTHIKRHTLDQVWSINLSVQKLAINQCVWSDHHLISFTPSDLSLPKSPAGTQLMTRNWNHINSSTFYHTLASNLPARTDNVDKFETAITNWQLKASDIHAPLHSQASRSQRHKASKWFSSELKLTKLRTRQVEPKWRKTYSPETREIYTQSLTAYKTAILEAKKAFFPTKS